MNVGPNLRKYVEDRNVMATLFRYEAMDVNNLTSENLKQLGDDLSSDLSPENLCCDGELRGRALQAKSRYLNAVRAELESLGVRVQA